MPLSKRRFLVSGSEWLAIELKRAASGHGLCYFLPLTEGSPSGDDRADRRALLEPSGPWETLGDEDLRALLEGAAPLTETERRFTDEEGKLWLIQSTGPVWAETGVAAGLTGCLATSLEDGRSLNGKDGVLEGRTEKQLRQLLAPVVERAETAEQGSSSADPAVKNPACSG